MTKINAIEQAVLYIQSHPEPKSVTEIYYTEAPGGPVEVDWSGMGILQMDIPCHKTGTITCGELAQRLAREINRLREVERVKRAQWGRRLDTLYEAKVTMQSINAKAQDPTIHSLIERMDDAILGIVRDTKSPPNTEITGESPVG